MDVPVVDALAGRADGLIEEREAELLRAVAETLDCPISPFVEIAPSQPGSSYLARAGALA